MKSIHFSLSTLLICFTSLFAQEIDSKFPNPEWAIYKEDSSAKVDIFNVSKKGKYLSESLVFNELGLLINEASFQKNKKETKRVTYSYNSAKKDLCRIEFRKGKFRRRTEYTYENDTLIISALSFFKDSLHAYYKSSFSYYPNGKNKVIEWTSLKKGNSSRLEYDYYENGSKKETRQYEKGKLKFRWSYDCSIEGDLVSKSKIDEKICKKRTYDTDSNYIEINEYLLKGKISRTITRANKNGLVLEYTNYNTKAKLVSRYVYQYNENQKLIKKTQFGSRSTNVKYIELYEYNSNSKLATSSRIDQGGAVMSRKEYFYN